MTNCGTVCESLLEKLCARFYIAVVQNIVEQCASIWRGLAEIIIDDVQSAILSVAVHHAPLHLVVRAVVIKALQDEDLVTCSIHQIN